ncbi:cytochrome P460 family protein [Chryseobacterium sp. ISL-6]|uniref:cytochrome P460 family protein n=1 Tax=Chryseobacterium sp. ISL-6 TaxID=2819143 RepID=UPI001BE5BEDC|nr:cytochrome P460 family protein [Chryseobacterium sp. ISL-6]MBT2622336.1 hypothetical protein [Chryseobacterium sp. ISL-6]
MKNINIAFLAIFFLLTACKNEDPNKDHVRLVFDAGHLKFIGSSLNKKKETMSALYGNNQALLSLSKKKTQPEAGTKMKLVTWKYHENPQYTGGTITGELLSIETVETNAKGETSYHKDNSSNKGNTQSFDKEQRIQYMLGYQPVVMP